MAHTTAPRRASGVNGRPPSRPTTSANNANNSHAATESSTIGATPRGSARDHTARAASPGSGATTSASITSGSVALAAEDFLHLVGDPVATLRQMSPVTIRRFLRRRGRRFALLAAVVVAAAVAAHHAAPMDMHAMPAGAICVAVVAGAALVGVALDLTATTRLGYVVRTQRLLRRSEPRTRRPAFRARAGPQTFLRLQVVRR